MQLSCLECEKIFVVRLSRFKRGAKYCSAHCRHLGHQKDVPWNKGTKGVIKPNSGSFKKGLIPWSKGKRLLMISGSRSPHWKGGRRYTRGYVSIYQPDHPFANERRKTIFEHRLIMERFLGRYLQQNEIVHHKNGIKDDNRIKNLELHNKHSHTTLHGLGKFKHGNSPQQRFCKKCNRFLKLNSKNFSPSNHHIFGFSHTCRSCVRIRNKQYMRLKRFSLCS